MSEESSKSQIKLDHSIGSVITRFSTLLKNLQNSKDSHVNEELWQIRSELELLIVRIKHSLGKELKEERWQKTFQTNHKGTSLKSKAIPMLEDISKTKTSVLNLWKKDQETCYRYLWKMKETITSVLNAFPTVKYTWVNGELKEEKEEIFEI